MVLVALGGAGCGEAVKAERVALVEDLDLAAEPVGLQPEGGLPEKVRLTVRNTCGAPVEFILPQPMVALAPPADASAGPVLTLSLQDAAGHEESPVYSDPRGRSWPPVKRKVLAPNAAWTGEYPLKAFHFWSSAGPDVEGDFTQYFWRGDRPVTLAAAIILGKDRVVRSKPISLMCRYEDRLFRKK